MKYKIIWYILRKDKEINWNYFIKEPFIVHDIKDCWDNNEYTNFNTWECISCPKVLKMYTKDDLSKVIREANISILEDLKQTAIRRWIKF